MKPAEALQKIHEIQTIILSGNRLVLSGPRILAYGIIFLLMPVITWVLNIYVFPSGIGQVGPLIFSLAVILFYGCLFWVGGAIVDRYFGVQADAHHIHPFLLKAFLLYWPILVAIGGLILALNLTGYGLLVFPLIYILLGILFNLLGRFSLPLIYHLSWSYILLGLLFVWLTQFHFRPLHSIFAIYLGLSLIWIGIQLQRPALKD